MSHPQRVEESDTQHGFWVVSHPHNSNHQPTSPQRESNPATTLHFSPCPYPGPAVWANPHPPLVGYQSERRQPAVGLAPHSHQQQRIRSEVMNGLGNLTITGGPLVETIEALYTRNEQLEHVLATLTRRMDGLEQQVSGISKECGERLARLEAVHTEHMTKLEELNAFLSGQLEVRKSEGMFLQDQIDSLTRSVQTCVTRAEIESLTADRLKSLEGDLARTLALLQETSSNITQWYRLWGLRTEDVREAVEKGSVSSFTKTAPQDACVQLLSTTRLIAHLRHELRRDLSLVSGSSDEFLQDSTTLHHQPYGRDAQHASPAGLMETRPQAEIVSLKHLGFDVVDARSCLGAHVISVQRQCSAARAGLEVGDIIIGFAKEPVESKKDLLHLLQKSARPGLSIPIETIPAGRSRALILRITIPSLPPPPS